MDAHIISNQQMSNSEKMYLSIITSYYHWTQCHLSLDHYSYFFIKVLTSISKKLNKKINYQNSYLNMLRIPCISSKMPS